MSQQNNFLGGFILGAVVGGAVGGVLGVLTASRLPRKKLQSQADALARRTLKRPAEKPPTPPTPQSIETARRGLEDKIAQLNDAIDDVRQKLGTVNGSPAAEVSDRVSDRPD